MKMTCIVLLAIAGIPGTSCWVSAQQHQESADPYFQPAGTATTTPVTSDSSRFKPDFAGTTSVSKPDATTPKPPVQTGGSFAPPAGPYERTASRDNFPTGTSDFRAPTTSSSKLPPSEPAALNTHSMPPTQSPVSTRVHEGTSFEPSRVLARVGGHPIFVSDLSVEAMQIIDKFIATAPKSVKKQEVKKILPRLLPKYIQSKLLLVDVMGSLPDGANVDEIFKSAGDQFDELMLPRLIKNTNVKSPAELDAYYRALGSSLRKVRQSWAESELVKYMMKSKININPNVSHREMFEYYQDHRDEYAIAGRTRWEQVMVRFDRFPTRKDAEQAISEMGQEIVYGAPLAAVAKRSSQGYKAQEGGDQGWTTRGSLVDKTLDKILFTIEPGKLSEIIPTSRGLAIVRVVERQDAGFVSFEKAQTEIREKILEQKQEAEFQQYIDLVKKRVPVEVFDPAFSQAESDDTRR